MFLFMLHASFPPRHDDGLSFNDQGSSALLGPTILAFRLLFHTEAGDLV